MKPSLRAVVPFLLAMLCAAAPALAVNPDANVVSRNGLCFNASTNQRVNCETGAVLTEDITQIWKPLNNNAMTTRFLYGADGVTTGWKDSLTTNRVTVVTFDSTQVIDTQGFKNLGLLFEVQFEDSVYAAQFALQQIPANGTGTDSSSSYDYLGEINDNVVNVGTLAQGNDSLGTLGGWSAARLTPSVITNATQLFGSSLGDTAQYLPGERPLILKPQRNHHSNAFVVVRNPPPYVRYQLRIQNTYNASLQAYSDAVSSATTPTVSTYGSQPVAGGVVIGSCEKCGGDPTANPIAWGRWVIVHLSVVGWN